MQSFKDAFVPNRRIPKMTRWTIAGAWVVLMLVTWSLFLPKVVPRPLEILSAFGRLWNEAELAQNLVTSLWLNFEALAIATLISFGIAYLTVMPAMRMPAALLSKFRYLGLVGLTFVFGLFFMGHQLKIGLLVFGMTVFYLTSMLEVVRSIPKERFDHARTLRMSEWRIVWEVVVLGTLDQAIEVLRQNAAIGWMMLTMVEGFVRAEGGIGVLILTENKHFKLEEVFAIQLTILAVGLLQDYGIAFVRRIICPYADLGKERS